MLVWGQELEEERGCKIQLMDQHTMVGTETIPRLM